MATRDRDRARPCMVVATLVLILVALAAVAPGPVQARARPACSAPGSERPSMSPGTVSLTHSVILLPTT